jgi:hypothetical protein
VADVNSNKQPTIALVVPYFGSWPAWMDAMLVSCAWNPDVDWHFLSDCEEPSDCPENVHFHKSSLQETAELAAKALGFPVHLERAYKLCDLKPAYGLMFPDLLKKYDFWGHCDPDILWGCIRKFMTPALLKQYDILSVRKGALAGHFCIYRNEERINRLCLQTPDWEQMLNHSEKSYMLDEAYFSDLIRDREACGEVRVYWKRSLATSGSDQRPALYGKGPMQWRRGRPIDAEGRPVSYKHWLFRGRPLKWEKGRTWNSYGQEVMYLHFHRLKGGFGPCSIRYADKPQTMLIDRTGIYS